MIDWELVGKTHNGGFAERELLHRLQENGAISEEMLVKNTAKDMYIGEYYVERALLELKDRGLVRGIITCKNASVELTSDGRDTIRFIGRGKRNR